ncbi:CD276 antigen-like isoform X2 [Conger conger]|uniref:CD276 antigen-like isoform X2 n=1 Tax=Conger conger TaxID=82655 RepID=UPI002A59DAD8|nr:CD276 antigen-like isoform X2 [Conger conger]
MADGISLDFRDVELCTDYGNLAFALSIPVSLSLRPIVFISFFCLQLDILSFPCVNMTMKMFSMMIVLQIFVHVWMVQLAESRASGVVEVIATLGQPVLLSCNWGKALEPNNIRVYWQGPGAGRGEKNVMVVHAYNKGKEEFTEQDSRYRNRTSMNRDLISQGNLSLLIKDIKAIDDNTQLIAHVQEGSANTQDICNRMLRVTAEFQKPEVNVSCVEGREELKIDCKSHGGFPKPKLSWTGLNQRGNNPSPIVTSNSIDGTYTIHSTLWVNISKDQRVTCHVTNPTSQKNINASIITYASCQVPPDHYLIEICSAVTVAVTLIIVAIFLYKRNLCCRKAQAPTTSNQEEEKINMNEYAGGDSGAEPWKCR